MSDEWIIGKNTVIEALESNRAIQKLYVTENLNASLAGKLQGLAKAKNAPVHRVPKKKLDQMVEGNHQGIAALVAAYEYATLDQLFQVAESRGQSPFFLILDEIEDPHNLGSILRSADATGVHGVIIPKRRAVGLTSTVAKTSVGAIEHIPVARVTNIAQTIDELKSRNVWIVGTEADATEDYRKLDGQLPIALVIGNEGKGISRLVKKNCDWTVSLPMAGSVSSLNASVAASLLMYEVFRTRDQHGDG
ncbi:23S rRNA (guanosine(2251)-2'-O)-methyltransferase RlmB [Gracilibacillus caseinilyticus]|uniref:23S rRNA (Guanosine(2251)-2'-O)-methyltransferase RlmB n=1 Tax=Gracilibacillus caseinilyticus TaxID=2932256 RepID=A0ABY4F038_9BACI|nr:23S rRNA (guanosine(2251)-2'-O)-methyltransferase RlmB [Gracilibacillus caseinilyticus]UOQ49473.1 23S rRNA (guanosine(2251)-2'-O)-methyltransferase RlmB [Gracilibacillus caseinilyticus]